METEGWASMLGMASGIPVSIVIAYIIIALVARFRRRNNSRSTQGERVPRKTHETKADTTVATNVDQHQQSTEDPDVIINRNSGKRDLEGNVRRRST